MSLTHVSKKTAEIYGGVGSLLTGFFCAGLSSMDAQAGQSIWRAWVVMSVILVVNGIAMLLHARKRSNEPLLPEGSLPGVLKQDAHQSFKVRN